MAHRWSHSRLRGSVHQNRSSIICMTISLMVFTVVTRVSLPSALYSCHKAIWWWLSQGWIIPVLFTFAKGRFLPKAFLFPIKSLKERSLLSQGWVSRMESTSYSGVKGASDVQSCHTDWRCRAVNRFSFRFSLPFINIDETVITRKKIRFESTIWYKSLVIREHKSERWGGGGDRQRQRV